MAEAGLVFYQGPSLLTGEPIVGILTGLSYQSNNPKTGPMLQSWILCPYLPPMDAVREGRDKDICGDCALRGDGGFNRRCYVPPWVAPNQVWKSFKKGSYSVVGWTQVGRALIDKMIRLGAYGDPAAIPFEVWQAVLRHTVGHIGYTHQWRSCDQRLKALVMASVDSEDEFHAAHLKGWRTFRIRGHQDDLLQHRGHSLEFICPASDESNHRTTCQNCLLCRGTSSPARSVSIQVHGHNGTMSAWAKLKVVHA